MGRPSIAVTGATGGIGRRVAQQLSVSGQSVRLVVRDPGRAPALDNAGVAIASYSDRDALRRAFDGISTLFFVSAAEAVDRLEQHLRVVEAAADAGIARIVYTSFLGAAPDATFTLARDHFHTEEHIRDAGLDHTFLRDSLYVDVLPYFVGDDRVIRAPAGDGRFAPVTRDDVADVASAVLLDPTGHDGRTYDVTGPMLLTMAHVADALSEATGRPVAYEAETIDEAYASRTTYGAPDWEVAGWVSSYAAIAAGELEVVSDTVERIAGHPPTDLRDWLVAHGDEVQHLQE